jgi:hypothetical protein
VHDALIKQFEKEKLSSVKANILTTLGELKVVKFSSELKQIACGSDNQLALRADVALSTIYGESMNEEERKKIALRLCHLASSPTTSNSESIIEEKRLVAVGLRNLKVDEDKVIETLLQLLEYSDESVRSVAGKALSIIQSKSDPSTE